MRTLITVLLLSFPAVASAQALGPLSEYKWVSRPIVVFADSPFDPRFKNQMKMLAKDPGALLERNVEILTDTDPALDGPLRQKLHPRGFMLVLIGKDGQIVLRKPTPWSVRELSRAIDKMPIRIDEINAKRGLTE